MKRLLKPSPVTAGRVDELLAIVDNSFDTVTLGSRGISAEDSLNLEAAYDDVDDYLADV